MTPEELVDELRSAGMTSYSYVADCIEDYLNADYGGTAPTARELAISACKDLIEAAHDAMMRLGVTGDLKT